MMAHLDVPTRCAGGRSLTDAAGDLALTAGARPTTSTSDTSKLLSCGAHIRVRVARRRGSPRLNCAGDEAVSMATPVTSGAQANANLTRLLIHTCGQALHGFSHDAR